MTRRLRHSDVAEAFKLANCELLSDSYVNAKTPLSYRCICGNISEISYDSFSRGRRCAKCGRERSSEKQRFGFPDVAEAFRDGGCELLETSFKGVKVPMRYRCSCGDVSKITYERFRMGGRCMTCGTEKAAGNLRVSFGTVKETFTEAGCVLLETTYRNNVTPMRYQCSCGKEGSTSYYLFRNGARCMACGILKAADANRLPTDVVIRAFYSCGYTLLEEYTRANDPIKCLCDKGHHIEISYSSLFKGIRCRYCYWETNRGNKHHKWNPELTGDDRERARTIQGIGDWRKAVFERDNYTCRKCKSRGVRLNAHHILNYSSHKEKRTEVGNGITFCETCHRLFHRMYGSKNNNDIQILEFLK